jgi:hypothetical protein
LQEAQGAGYFVTDFYMLLWMLSATRRLHKTAGKDWLFHGGGIRIRRYSEQEKALAHCITASKLH